ncbi:MAG: hypothetical protein MJZ33_09745 [Paludibacteraceae bacterium]|nr:hypothetical protein [Paludibacteraceae bacterium]
MAELNEISIKARSKAHDFIWFSSKPNSFVWFNKYKPFFNESEDLLNCTVEIDSDHYKIYFGKIYSQKVDHQNRRTYYTLQVGDGKRGSTSSQYMYKLICAYLSDVYSSLQNPICEYHRYCKDAKSSNSDDSSIKASNERDSIKEEISKSKISTLFDREFPEEYISSIFPDKGNLPIEVEAEIQDKLQKIIDELSFENESFNEQEKSDEVFVFDSMKARLNLFLSELKKITTDDPVSKKIALILTNRPLNADDLNQFDKGEYSKVVCLSTNDAESDTLPLTHKDTIYKPTQVVESPSLESRRQKLKEIDDPNQKKNPVETPKSQNVESTPEMDFRKKIILGAIVFLILLIIYLIICTPNTTESTNGSPQTGQTRSEWILI